MKSHILLFFVFFLASGLAFGETRCLTGEDPFQPGDSNRIVCDGIHWEFSRRPDGCGEGCRFIVDIHGKAMNASDQKELTRFEVYDPNSRYIVLRPRAPDPGWFRFRAWTVTRGMIPARDPAQIDAAATINRYSGVAAFLREVVEKWGGKKPVIHVSGFSQGALLSWWLACHHPGLITSIAPVAYSLVEKLCPNGPSPRVAVFYTHGVCDRMDLYGSGPLRTWALLTGGPPRPDPGQALEDEACQGRHSWHEAVSKDGVPLEMVSHGFLTSKRHFYLNTAGHCLPSPGKAAPTRCHSQGFDWSREALAFFAKAEARTGKVVVAGKKP